MLSTEWFKDKRITVMGLGLHGGGAGAARWLMRHGAKVTVTDLKSRRELESSVADLERAYAQSRRCGRRVRRFRYVLGRHDPEDFCRVDMVIRNPAVPRENSLLKLAGRSGVPIESDIGIFFRLCPFPITAVSGTKGKTTTTALLAEICRRHDRRTVVGGNIRLSPLDELDRLIRMAGRGESAPPVVLELSSWQLEGLRQHRLSPSLAILTNVMADHLNRYRGMADYARAKELILAFQDEGDAAVLNADDRRVAEMGRRLKKRLPGRQGGIYWFSRRERKGTDGCFLSGRRVICRIGGRRRLTLPLDQIRIVGNHNLGNVMAACAAALIMGIPARSITAAIKVFRGVPGRLEKIAVRRGVTFVNDTTATAPAASIAALRALGDDGRRIILLAGGADKKLEFGEWARQVKRRVRQLVMFEGTATPKMVRALKAAGSGVPMTSVGSMPEAVRTAYEKAGEGDIILLSPGCASFGLFINEFDRGDRFVAAVGSI